MNYKENYIKKNFAKQTYISYLISLLSTTQSKKVLPANHELYDVEEIINNSETRITISDDCSTIELSNSFRSVEGLEESLGENDYLFNPNNFKMLSILGSGSYGIVFLAEYETQIYAVKKLSKHKINKIEMEKIMSEKQSLMLLTNHPFILNLYGTCQTNNDLYFVTEAIEFGDLFNAIHVENNITPEACVFYIACIILSINFIHSKNIVYRDLKPENIMIGSNGYPKIIDFGLAKQLPYMKMCNDGIMRKYTKCYTLCGTNEYLAPETILKDGYDGAVDIWAIGILLYEMIFKITPFVDESGYVPKLFENIILSSKYGFHISKKINKKTDGTNNASNLIKKLLSGNKNERIGDSEPSTLLNHPYFSSKYKNADDLYNQTIEPPILQPQFMGHSIKKQKNIKEYLGDQDIFKEFF